MELGLGQKLVDLAMDYTVGLLSDVAGDTVNLKSDIKVDGGAGDDTVEIGTS
jgi:hypothetical protein